MFFNKISKIVLSPITATAKVIDKAFDADVNKPSRTFGTTPLQIAFKKNDFKTAYLLYRYEADLFYVNDPYKGGTRYDIKFYAKTKKAKQLFSLLEELEKDKANNKVRGEIEKLCM